MLAPGEALPVALMGREMSARGASRAFPELQFHSERPTTTLSLYSRRGVAA